MDNCLNSNDRASKDNIELQSANNYMLFAKRSRSVSQRSLQFAERSHFFSHDQPVVTETIAKIWSSPASDHRNGG
ncbi:MAG: hypothetical protein AAFQ57_05645 [Cyanobacteria bacterium J06626_14]